METMEQSAFAYDQVAYPGWPDIDSHLRYVHANATLAGLQPRDIRNCRVLEIGCAAGHNLLPQAVEFPESHFVGVDLSEAQLQAAQQTAAGLSLTNVELHNASFEVIDESWGEFDYIICLGVYSWVEAALQDRLVAVCRERLAPQGAALISYIVNPGWRHQSSIRDALRYHTRHITEPADRIRAAREALDHFADGTPADTPHGQQFRELRDYLSGVGDDYLFHDYLVDDNRPTLFHKFHERLSSHGLQYLTEINPACNSPHFGTAETRAHLQSLPLVDRCQMLDFLRNESYRKSIVCPAGVTVDPVVRPEQLNELLISLRQIPTPREFDASSSTPVHFRFAAGSLHAAHPLGKAALKYLIDMSPHPVSLGQLQDGALSHLPPGGNYTMPGRTVEDLLAVAMLGAFSAGLIRFSRYPAEAAQTLSERPEASRYARHVSGDDQGRVTSLHHSAVVLDAFARRVLSMLDGTRTRADLLAQLETDLQAGNLEHIGDAEALSTRLDDSLQQLLEGALLLP